MRLHEVENPLLVVVKHANPDCIEEVGHRDVADSMRNMLKDVASSVNLGQREFGIRCLGVGIAERLILVVIPPLV